MKCREHKCANRAADRESGEQAQLDPAEDRRQVVLDWFDASACRAAATVLEEYATGTLDSQDEDPDATLECAQDLRAIAGRWQQASASRLPGGE